MAYKLEHSSDEQKTLLSNTLQKWGNCQPDVYLISLEGHKIYTQRVLLGLSSKLIDELLNRTPGLGDLPGISVPASSGSLVNLLKILTTGVAIADNKLHLLEASRTAELLGIKLLNCQIGSKKKKQEVGKPVDDNRESIGFKEPSPNARKRKLNENIKIPKRTKVERVTLDTVIKEEFNEQDQNEGVVNGSTDVENVPRNVAQKKHQCEQCDKSFSSRQAMLRHVIVHSDNPTPFDCNLCEKKFDRKDRVARHMKTAHINMHDEVVDEDDENYGNESEVQENPQPPIDNEEINENESEEEVAKSMDNSETEELEGSALSEGVEVEDEENLPENEDENSSDGTLDPMVKEKLLADRQKLLAELNSIEGQGDLDFLK